MPNYYNVVEVETALEVFAQEHPSIITRFALPELTWEGRQCHAVKIASGTGPGRVGVYVMGGIHAREWATPDALVDFIEIMANAYDGNKGVSVGGKTFTWPKIRSIVEKLDLFVFPQTNPDGRHASLTVVDQTYWRKNRRPRSASDPTPVGVDCNRNFDFLWNYPTYFFNSGASVVNSVMPADETYIGPSAFSEPETRNIVSIVNSNPNIAFFVDVHAFGELVLQGWGDDETQTADTSMTFRNSAFDGARGVTSDAYREYAPPKDLAQRAALAARAQTAIAAVRGRAYKVQSSFALYPTAGTSTDYMESRRFVVPGAGGIRAFTFECGQTFFPDEIERSHVMNEVIAGLIELCLAVLDQPADVYVRDNLADSGAEPTPDGGLSMSPDIHHFKQSLGEPATTLGSAVAMLRNDLFEPIEKGQDNFLYVRLQNRGVAPSPAEVDIYWSRPSTFPTPSGWNLIGTISVPNVVPGQATVGGPLVWPAASVPETGHYCFIAIVGTPGEPRPNKSSIASMEDFQSFIRQNNGVAWKNFDVVDVLAGTVAQVQLMVQGWPHQELKADLEIDLRALPSQSSAELALLGRLTVGTTLSGLIPIETEGTRYTYRLAGGSIAVLRGMPLKPSDRSEVRLEVSLATTTPAGAYDIAVIQRIEGREVGRVSRRLAVGDYPYVGNARTQELHRSNCEWVRQMWPGNKRAFREIETPLRSGYNGCATCLSEFDAG
jgi:carboxypeptidase T